MQYILVDVTVNNLLHQGLMTEITALITFHERFNLISFHFSPLIDLFYTV